METLASGGFANLVDNIKGKYYDKDAVDGMFSALGTVMDYKGTVANYAALPANADVGDVYNLLDTGANYAWTGTEWDMLGSVVDLTGYATEQYVDDAIGDIDLSGYALKSEVPDDTSDLTNGAGFQTASDVASAIAGKADSSSLGTAAAKNYETTLTDGSNLPTGSAVKSYVDDAIGGVPIYSLPTMSTSTKGGAKVGTGLAMSGDALGLSGESYTSAEKQKLDGIEANANNYSLPTMSSAVKGGAKLGHGLSVEDDALNLGPLTASGSGASVQTDGCGIFGVMGDGWAEQTHYTGKNLFDVTATYVSSSGVASRSTSNGNYTLTRAGALTAYDWFLISGLTVGQQYTLSIGGTSESNIYAYVQNSEGTSTIGWVPRPELSFTFTATETSCRIGMSVGKESTDATGTIYHPMLEAGSTATEWEPGYQSPSPDYPQEIRVARGRNLFDKSKIELGKSINGDGTFSTNSKRMLLRFIGLNPGGQYTISMTSSEYTVFIALYTSSGTFKRYIDYPSSYPYTFTANPDEGKAAIAIKRTADDRDLTNADISALAIQFEAGSTPTPYVPYGHVGLEVTTANLLDEYTALVGYRGDWSTGAPASNSAYSMSDFIPVDPNADYYGLNLAASGSWYTLAVFDSGKNFLRRVSISSSASTASGVVNVGSDAAYVRVNWHHGDTTEPALFKGSTAQSYEPHRHVTPIPLPAKGFAGALPDGTKDTLAIDSAGRVEWVNASGIVTPKDFSLGQAASGRALFVTQNVSSHGWGVDDVPPILATHMIAVSYSASWSPGTASVYTTTGGIVVSVDPTVNTQALFASTYPTLEVLYPLAEQTSESAYIQLPELPEGATVSIPELEAIGVEWWVEGAEAIAEHGRDVSRANKEQEDRIAELEAAVANLATS